VLSSAYLCTLSGCDATQIDFTVTLLWARRSPATIAKSLAGTVKNSGEPNPSDAAPAAITLSRINLFLERRGESQQRPALLLFGAQKG
jgi:hypothetical protein